MKMERVAFLEHHGKRILHVDLSELKEPEQIIEVLSRARPVIDAQPPKSLLLLTNCLGARYEARGAEAVKGYSKVNSPFIRASAVTGGSASRRYC
jgi:hypothetical protein